jgi:hypothetical protein
MLHVNMFHYFQIPYFTCKFFTKFTYNEYIEPYFLSHVVIRFSPLISPRLQEGMAIGKRLFGELKEFGTRGIVYFSTGMIELPRHRKSYSHEMGSSHSISSDWRSERAVP